ncbi:MAG: hypothetical protein K0S86_5084, partial [Geminicoccaceae bacterium]|nr:hypothetical protein [Geminicoccaceae bacterium]
ALERITATVRELFGEPRLAASSGTREGEKSRRAEEAREVFELAFATYESREVNGNVRR